MSYDEGSIKVLEGLEAVRERPGMYIGGTDINGFHHLLWEIVDNSVDEAIAGHATTIEVTLDGNKASVKDNGRGIPFGRHPKAKKSTLDVIFTTLHAGGKFGSGAYKGAGGLHGVGSSVVNALSTELTVQSTRDGETAKRTFKRGVPSGKLTKTTAPKSHHGTTVEFCPDIEIFGKKRFDVQRVREMLKVKAYLTSGVRFILRAKGEEDEFCFSGGLNDYLADTLKESGEDMVTEFPFFVDIDEPRVQVSLVWTSSAKISIKAFANGIPTQDGGTHVKGLDAAVVSEVKKALDRNNSVPKRLKITPDDIREGLTAFISVFVADPQFQGQTKDRLNNPEVKKAVQSALSSALESWLLDNQEQTERLVLRVMQSARARHAARDASIKVRRSSPTSRAILPGKLADCSSRTVEDTELFLVEGDSAGGSAKMARDRKTQAILPLRGKILNSEGIPLAKVMKNEELKSIVTALGCGIGASFDINSLRYGKIILLMDADSDGHHIAVLALTFFYRHLPELIDAGRVYIAVPPLYRVNKGLKTFWVNDDAGLNRLRKKLKDKLEITRFKGLGEMPPNTLKETTMDPGSRVLQQVSIPDHSVLETESVISAMMGRDASARHDILMTTIERTGDLSRLDL